MQKLDDFTGLVQAKLIENWRSQTYKSRKQINRKNNYKVLIRNKQHNWRKLQSLETSCMNSCSGTLLTVSYSKPIWILKNRRQWKHFTTVTPTINTTTIRHSWCNQCLSASHKSSQVTALQRKVKGIDCMGAKLFMNFNIMVSDPCAQSCHSWSCWFLDQKKT